MARKSFIDLSSPAVRYAAAVFIVVVVLVLLFLTRNTEDATERQVVQPPALTSSRELRNLAVGVPPSIPTNIPPGSTERHTTSEPTSAPTESTAAPVTSQPTESTAAPVTSQPTSAPTEATAAPVTSQPTESTAAPVTSQPTSAPTEATAAPVTSQPTAPTPPPPPDQRKFTPVPLRGLQGFIGDEAPLAPNEVLLFVGVMSQYDITMELMEQLAKVNRESQTYIKFRPIIIDNTGCNLRELPHEVQSDVKEEDINYLKEKQHMNYNRLVGRQIDCGKWFSVRTAFVEDSNARILVPASPLNFGETQNFMHRYARQMGKTTYIWAHNDATADSVIMKKIGQIAMGVHVPFCLVYFSYDAIAVFNATALADRVGDWDEHLWYYGDIDYYDRCSLAGLVRMDVAEIPSGVKHKGSAFTRKEKEKTVGELLSARREMFQDYFHKRRAKLQLGENPPAKRFCFWHPKEDPDVMAERLNAANTEFRDNFRFKALRTFIVPHKVEGAADDDVIRIELPWFSFVGRPTNEFNKLMTKEAAEALLQRVGIPGSHYLEGEGEGC